MLIDLNKLKDLSIESRETLILKEILLEEMDFINNFLECVKLFDWSYGNQKISKEKVLDILVRFSLDIVNKEIENLHININSFSIARLSTGRITVQPTDFEREGNHIWLEIEFFTSL